MIFEEMRLENFRQFRGVQTITFATDPRRNVTVIHGFNGSGKTTLLNAFLWFEFAQLALNGPEAMHSLLPIRDAYDLLDLVVEA